LNYLRIAATGLSIFATMNSEGRAGRFFRQVWSNPCLCMTHILILIFLPINRKVDVDGWSYVRLKCTYL